MAYTKTDRNKVRGHYVHQFLTLRDAAAVVGATVDTARRWKKADLEIGDDWDQARNASRMASEGLGEMTASFIEEFYMQMQHIMEALKEDQKMGAQAKVDCMSKLSDSYSKLVASAMRSGTKVAPFTIAMRVINLLTKFIDDKYPEHKEAFIEILEPFGHELSRQIG